MSTKPRHPCSRLPALVALVLFAGCSGSDQSDSSQSPEVAAVLIPVYSPVARAQGNLVGGDTVMVDGDCFESANWSALVSRSSEPSENEILLAGEPCVRDPSWATWRIPIDENTFVAGLHGNWLFLDSGTGPDARDLAVYSLTSGDEIAQTPYVHDELAVDGSSLRFFLPVERPTGSECAGQAEWEEAGFGTGFEQEVLLNLETGARDLTERLTCSPRQ